MQRSATPLLRAEPDQVVQVIRELLRCLLVGRTAEDSAAESACTRADRGAFKAAPALVSNNAPEYGSRGCATDGAALRIHGLVRTADHGECDEEDTDAADNFFHG
jgi:hypothetical protein